MLSIIIPTYNSATRLEKTLETVKGFQGEYEIIVSDGASHDATTAIAANAGAKVLCGARGRGAQLDLGAQAASGDWLLFLHSDTILGDGWAQEVQHFIDTSNTTRAAYFRFALDDPSPAARRLEKMVGWRCKTFHLPYGDQGLLMPTPLYQAVGGYPDFALMEDVYLVRKLGKKRLVGLDVVAVTSAEKFRRDGYMWRSTRNLICLSLFFLGVSPTLIAKLYGK